MFLIALAYHSRDQVVLWVQEARPGEAVFALAALLLSNVGVGLVFSSLLKDEEAIHEGVTPAALSVFLLSQIAKYIPGRIWIVLMQHSALGGQIAARKVVAVNLEIAVMSLATSLGAAGVFWAGAEIGSVWMVPMAAILVVGVRAIIHLRITTWAQAFLLHFFPSWSPAEVTPQKRLGSGATLGVILAVAGYCVGWLALIHAGGVDLDSALRIAALLSLSYIVGMLSFLPAGLGAREVTLLALGAWVGPLPLAMASVAVITRLAMIILDAAAALLASTWFFFGLTKR